MDKKTLMAMLAKVKAKIKEKFEAMLESSKDEDIKAYENLLKQAKDLEEQIALVEKEELDEGGTIPEGLEKEDKKPKELSEREKFGQKIVEAVSKGTSFTGLLPRECTRNIQMKKEQIARVRGLCTVHPASGEYTIWVEGDDVVVDYINENGAFGETTPSINGVGLAALKLGALTKISEEYIADLGVDVMGYIEEKFAKAFAKKEDKEIIFGSGTSSSKTKLRGVAVNAAAANIVTAASETTVTWAEVKQTIQKLKAYRGNATIVCSQEFLDIVHEFKDGNTYMFHQANEIKQIMGIPVVVSGEFPTLGSEAVAMVVGDFSYYHICDRQSVEVKLLPELYAANGQVGVRGQERIDGDLTVKEAFAVLKMKKAAG